MNYKIFFKYLFVSALFALSYSCTRYKNIVYMQDRLQKADSTLSAVQSGESAEIKIKPDDNLFVNIYGNNIGSIGLFNKETNKVTNYSELSLYVQSYIVDKDGFIDLPVIGKVNVNGLTLYECQSKLQELVNEYIKDVIVEIRFVNYNVTILGEVARPGTYGFYKREANIFEAVSRAGGVSNFGDLRNVMVIRKNGNLTETVKLDFTNSDFMKNPYYWLQPNDIVYIKPLRAKVVNLNATGVSLIISSISLLVLILTYTK